MSLLQSYHTIQESQAFDSEKDETPPAPAALRRYLHRHHGRQRGRQREGAGTVALDSAASGSTALASGSSATAGFFLGGGATTCVGDGGRGPVSGSWGPGTGAEGSVTGSWGPVAGVCGRMGSGAAVGVVGAVGGSGTMYKIARPMIARMNSPWAIWPGWRRDRRGSLMLFSQRFGGRAAALP